MKALIERYYKTHTDFFSQTKAFQNLELGAMTAVEVKEFIASMCRTHVRSPKILGFLFALVPPCSDDSIKHNLLEELGLEDGHDDPHPDLLLRLAAAAGFGEAELAATIKRADESLRDLVCRPLQFDSLRDVGLSVLLEVVGFEWMLSRLSSRIGLALEGYGKLNKKDLEWFFHHSEVDIAHAEQGIEAVIQYIDYYKIDNETVEMIMKTTFRNNIFCARYFGERS